MLVIQWYAKLGLLGGGFTSLGKLESIWLQNGQTVNRETFVQVLRETLDPPIVRKEFELQMSLLFYRMDTNSDGGVDWDEFCTHIMLSLEEKFQATLLT